MSGRRVVGARFDVFGTPKAWKFIGVKLTPLLFMRRKIIQCSVLTLTLMTQTSALPLSLPFLVEHAYQTMDLMGEDFRPHGLENNRHTLETFVRYMHEQGLVPEPMALETLFPESTQRTFRV